MWLDDFFCGGGSCNSIGIPWFVVLSRLIHHRTRFHIPRHISPSLLHSFAPNMAETTTTKEDGTPMYMCSSEGCGKEANMACPTCIKVCASYTTAHSIQCTCIGFLHLNASTSSVFCLNCIQHQILFYLECRLAFHPHDSAGKTSILRQYYCTVWYIRHVYVRYANKTKQNSTYIHSLSLTLSLSLSHTYTHTHTRIRAVLTSHHIAHTTRWYASTIRQLTAHLTHLSVI